MTDIPTLTALRDRVAGLTGHDDDADYAITQAFDPGAVRYSSAHLHYTASIDAAVALIKTRAPVTGANIWGVECYSPFDRESVEYDAHVSRNNVAAGHWLKEATHEHPAIALILAQLDAEIASLNALIAEQEASDV